MSPNSAMLSGADGPWIEQWLSAARLSTYRAATSTRAEALDLYEWNTAVAASAHHDICHIEVALRNAYSAAIERNWTNSDHWTQMQSAIFPPVIRRRGRDRVDINSKNRELLQDARKKVGGPAAPAGKVIAELTFGFWRFLTTGAHEKTLWVPYLHHAFPPGTDRSADVDKRVTKIYDLRNRIAHHEPLVRLDLSSRVADMAALASLLSPELGSYLAARSTLSELITERPTMNKTV